MRLITKLVDRCMIKWATTQPNCLKEFVDILTPREREIFILYWFKGVTQKAISVLYDISTTRVRQILERIEEKHSLGKY